MSDVSVGNVPLSTLHDAPSNPNHMDEDKYLTLVRAMKEKGFLQPVLVREVQGRMEIVDGHHRVKAARELGMSSVPAVVVDEMDDADAAILRIGMNRLRGELDLTSVGLVLKELQAGGLLIDDLTITGYSESEVADLLHSVSQGLEDGIPKDMEMPADDFEFEVPDDTVKPFELKILFLKREEFTKAKRGLRRAAGKGKDLAEGLMRLLGEEKGKAKTNESKN